MVTSVARGFVESISNRDSTRLRALFSQQIDFKGISPTGVWEARGPDEVLKVLFSEWIRPSYRMVSLDRLDIDAFADQERVGARLLVERDEEIFVVELQAFLGVAHRKIASLHAMSSGLRPLTSGEAEGSAR